MKQTKNRAIFTDQGFRKPAWVVGIDIGGTHFRIGAVNYRREVEHFRKIPVRDVFYTGDALADLAKYLTDYCALLTTEGIIPEAAAIGFPATLDRSRKKVLQAPNIPFMENLPVAEVLSETLHIPVYIERDVCMALCYDQQKYQIPACEVLIGCYFGTGIGNAISINGKTLIGKDGAAGELGHIPADGSRLPCGCGNLGCMENLAGGKYLASLCENTYTHTPIGEIFTRHGREPLLLQFVDRIAMTVATEINILNPDYILIGGGVPQMRDFPLAYLDERIHFHTRKPYPEQSLQLIYTDDAENKCVLGAAIYAHGQYNKG